MKSKIQKPEVPHYNMADHIEFHETPDPIFDVKQTLIEA
jgi:hypothetical protein